METKTKQEVFVILKNSLANDGGLCYDVDVYMGWTVPMKVCLVWGFRDCIASLLSTFCRMEARKVAKPNFQKI